MQRATLKTPALTEVSSPKSPRVVKALGKEGRWGRQAGVGGCTS